MFNDTFSNISVVSWPPVLLVVETEVPREHHRSDAGNGTFYPIMLYRVHSNI
jgi:hypothetical protein